MKIEILTSHKDILGVASMKDGDPREVNTSWSPQLAATMIPTIETSLRLLNLIKEENFLRVVVGTYTIVVQREHGYIIAACITTGHDIAKSLHRMIRRAAKPARGKKEVDGG